MTAVWRFAHPVDRRGRAPLYGRWRRPHPPLLLTLHPLRPRPPGTNGQGVVSLRAQFLPFNDLSSPKKQQLVDEAVAASGPVLPSVSAAPPPVEAAAEGPAVGEAVEAASKTAVEAIEGAAGKIEEKLMAAGVDGKVGRCLQRRGEARHSISPCESNAGCTHPWLHQGACHGCVHPASSQHIQVVDALASVKLAAVERAKAAAGTVSSFVESQGISALPARDLTKILASMSTSYEGGASSRTAGERCWRSAGAEAPVTRLHVDLPNTSPYPPPTMRKTPQARPSRRRRSCLKAAAASR